MGAVIAAWPDQLEYNADASFSLFFI